MPILKTNSVDSKTGSQVFYLKLLLAFFLGYMSGRSSNANSLKDYTLKDAVNEELSIQPTSATTATATVHKENGQQFHRQDFLPHLPDCNKPQSPLSLTELGKKYKPTKFVKYAHTNYNRLYPLYLEKYRTKKFRMLEIGLDSGAGSLMWREYFPCAKLYGLEYQTSTTQTQGAISITTIQGDQGNKTFLEGEFLRQTGGNFDVIVDDGGHHYEQQSTSYIVLFEKALNPGGVYLLEDIETSYWKKGTSLYGTKLTRGGFTEPKTVVNKFKQLVDVVNKKFFDNSYTVFGPVDHWVATVSFLSNLIILTKKDAYHCYNELQYIWPRSLADDCPAKKQSVNSIQKSPMVAYCGKNIIQRDSLHKEHTWNETGSSR